MPRPQRVVLIKDTDDVQSAFDTREEAEEYVKGLKEEWGSYTFEIQTIHK